MDLHVKILRRVVSSFGYWQKAQINFKDGFFYIFSPLHRHLRTKECLDDCIIQNSNRSRRAFKVIIGKNKYTIKSKTLESKKKLIEQFRNQKTMAV